MFLFVFQADALTPRSQEMMGQSEGMAVVTPRTIKQSAAARHRTQINEYPSLSLSLLSRWLCVSVFVTS
jgi:hypothetical protein